MNRPRLILHAGLHKTGTTAIQSFCAANRDALRARGLWYPPFDADEADSRSHNRLAHSLAGTGKSNAYSGDRVAAALARWHRDAGDDSLLLSAEALSRHVDAAAGEDWVDRRRGYLGRVAEALASFDVEPVIVLRRQDEFVHSAYLENIMKGARRARWPFPEFRRYLAGRHLRYEDNIDAFMHRFGRVRVLIYDDLRAGDGLCRSFLAQAGFDVGDLPEPGRIRGSLAPGPARLKRALLPIVVSRGQNRRINALLGSDTAGRLLGSGRQRDRLGFWESERTRRDWLDGYRAENERIRRRFLPERPQLFPDRS